MEAQVSAEASPELLREQCVCSRGPGLEDEHRSSCRSFLAGESRSKVHETVKRQHAHSEAVHCHRGEEEQLRGLLERQRPSFDVQLAAYFAKV
jgi:hypothetical protein